MKLTLLTYRVEADMRIGLTAIVRAESYWDALVAASALWDIPTKHISAYLHSEAK